MAGGKERILRRRIRSIQSTKKITKAMELIAASRIVRAQQRVAAARPYAEQIAEVIQSLAQGGADASSPLLTPKPEADVRRVGFVVITADRGLAGAYNSNVIRAAERALQAEVAKGREYQLVVVGRKGQSYFRYRGYTINDFYTGMSDTPAYEDARQVAEAVTRPFEDGELDRVFVAYTQFLSAGTQRPVVRQLMPVEIDQQANAGRDPHAGPQSSYEFEPEPSEILTRLLPRYVESRLFAAMLDSAASEHAARQRAMKAATDNAEDLIVRLSRVMNRARQDAITTEIMEIVGGAEALRQAGDETPDLLLDTVIVGDLFTDQLTRDR
jgi:F-type H+-transporting ATPase subunit gamma